MFSVCVTKPLPLNDLRPIIRRFCKQKLSFGLLENRPGFFEIWREPFEDENMISLREPYYRGVIRLDPPDQDKFCEIYEAGKRIIKNSNLRKNMQIKMCKN